MQDSATRSPSRRSAAGFAMLSGGAGDGKRIDEQGGMTLMIANARTRPVGTIVCRACGARNALSEKRCARCGAPIVSLSSKDVRQLFWAIPIVCGAAGLLAFAVISSPVREQAPKKSPTAVALQNLTLEFSTRMSGFGHVMMGDFTVVNHGDRSVKDVGIRCVQFANSGTPVGTSSHVLYDVFPAHGERGVSDFNMGFVHSQTATTECRIVSLGGF